MLPGERRRRTLWQRQRGTRPIECETGAFCCGEATPLAFVPTCAVNFEPPGIIRRIRFRSRRRFSGSPGAFSLLDAELPCIPIRKHYESLFVASQRTQCAFLISDCLLPWLVLFLMPGLLRRLKRQSLLAVAAVRTYVSRYSFLATLEL